VPIAGELAILFRSGWAQRGGRREEEEEEEEGGARCSQKV